MDYPLIPSISRSSSNRDRDRERDDNDADTLVDTSNIASTNSRSSRMRLGVYGTTTGLAASSSTSSFPLISSTSDSGSTSTTFLAPRLTRHSSHPNTNSSTLSAPSHPGTNIHAHSSSHSHRATSHSHQHPTHEFPYPMHSYGHAGLSSRSSAASVSMCSTAANSPTNSRAGSPSPFFYSSTGSISSSDEDESEPPSPYLNSAGGTAGAWWREDSSSTSRRRWPWLVNGGGGLGGLATHPRRRRRMNGFGFRTFKRLIRRLMCRRPFIPKQPVMILLTLLILIAFGTSLTFLLVHILNPDKEPLPWRYYCSVPSTSTAPPSLYPSTSYLSHIKTLHNAATNPPPDFPPSDLDSIPPVGVFVGVFSLDSSFERRQLIRSTWAGHKRSRCGAGEGDGGFGTSRTIVRFILGEPSKDWARRIMLEMETYNDIVIVPMYENMNAGKTHAYVTWASSNALVPASTTAFPSSLSSPVNGPFTFSYSNATFPAPLVADHDPIQVLQDRASGHMQPWVRPDFVVKADDDAFVMLAELESRLRVRLHDEIKPGPSGNTQYDGDEGDLPIPSPSPKRGKGASSSPSRSSTSSVRTPTKGTTVDHPVATVSYPPFHEASSPKKLEDDPLIYWGYLVKNRFMAGELYALSWALVDWVARDPVVKTKTKGAEDKQTAKWVMMHPKAHQIKWASERCWIYDHPRAGTVYSHGFLFPSEVTRVKKFLFSYLDMAPKRLLNRAPTDPERQRHLNGADGGADGQDQVPGGTDVSVRLGTPLAWAHSSVSTFGARYSPPIQDMSLWHSVEALVEGSDMSMLREDSPMTPDYAWAHREGRNTRYDNKRVGGTVCVHFIKKNMWFLETALTFLEMQDTTELEMHPSEPDEDESELVPLGSAGLDSKNPRPRSGSSSAHRENPESVPVDVELDLADSDTKNEHDVLIRPNKDMHVLLVQAGAEGFHIDVEGGGGRSGDPVVLPTDELNWSEGVPGDESRRGVNSDVHGERGNEATVSLPPTGHFANGSRRVNNR